MDININDLIEYLKTRYDNYKTPHYLSDIDCNEIRVGGYNQAIDDFIIYLKEQKNDRKTA